MQGKATAAHPRARRQRRLDETVAALGLALMVLAVGGCHEIRAAMGELERTAIAAPAKPAVPASNVIPTADPIEVLTVVIADERSLAGLATALGATIDDIMIDNQLDDSRVGAGVALKVRTTQSRLTRYLQARERRQARRAKRDEARRAKSKRRASKRTTRNKRKKRARASAASH